MTQSQIRARVNELYKLIEDNIDPCSFVLNEEVKKYSDEIESLQKQCAHEFHNGICIHCDKPEK